MYLYSNIQIKELTLQKSIMAHTAHKNQDDKKEFFDTQEQLNEKIEILAKLIINSKHFIAFTGAGISTACGIPDFRSGVNTKLETGPGAWQKKAHNIQSTPNKKIVGSQKALPSFTHMALVKLQQEGLLKFLISQNTDGLHLRSGFDPTKLAQLHGNRCLEKCKKCKSQFLRDFRTRQAKQVHQHATSRKCQKCGNTLYDSIINFGQNLPQYEINKAFEEGYKADVCLAMGSSLTVTPAADVPLQVGKKNKLIIVNLQKTPLDKYAYLRINGMCDKVMELLTKKLKLQIESFKLTRLIKFELDKNMDTIFRGIDSRGIPFSFFKQVGVKYDKEKAYKSLKSQPYKVSMQHHDKMSIKLDFYQFLGQPPIVLQFDKQPTGLMKLVYNPYTHQWVQKQKVDQKKELKKIFDLD